MRIACVGGGPGGLYFALLMKKARPEAEIRVFERNRPDDTFGWGVVFSDETLTAFRDADPATYDEITARFRHWTEIETHYRGTVTVSTGHGFAAISRRELLAVLQRRCLELGVELEFEREVEDPERLRREYDLLVAADGIASGVRSRYADEFGPHLDTRACRFSWLGTDLPLDAFTFVFEESPWGLFQVHAYPFERDRSTFIVECREEVWERAGLAEASEEETVAFCERLFRDTLGPHRLLSNRSVWRRFETVRCRTWHHENVVLVGDAAHTAHFSVGSGTKLAMEDAIALVEAFRRGDGLDVPAVLRAYEDARWVDVVKLQKAAQTSLEWFEESARYLALEPLQLTVSLMTRSKRITWDNLAARDPELVDRVARAFRERAGVPVPPGEPAPPPIFTPLRLRALELENRVVVSPMCQYSAEDGCPGEWHLVHLGSRAVGGAGLVLTEMTDVSADGRITLGCAGLYDGSHEEAWGRIVTFVHEHSRARIGVQLAHAGRKGSVHHPWEGADRPLTAAEGAWETIAPSARPFAAGWPPPREMDRADMDEVIAAFVRATRRAESAGFDLVELHMAHGYLLSSFLSPVSNRRSDGYGGSIRNRMRFPLEVFEAVRAAWPEARPISVRLTAHDWLPGDGGTDPDEAVEVARALATAGCDVIDVSSGGNSPRSRPVYGRMYQVPFAEKIRFEAGIPVMAVGAILGADHANTVLAAGRADLVAMARPHLRDPYLTLRAAERYEVWDHPWPDQYRPAAPRPPRPAGRRPELEPELE